MTNLELSFENISEYTMKYDEIERGILRVKGSAVRNIERVLYRTFSYTQTIQILIQCLMQ